MSSDVFKIEEMKFRHEQVRIKALEGLDTAEFKDVGLENAKPESEINVYRWVAQEFLNRGLASLISETPLLNATELERIRFREAVQASRKLTSLPRDFFHRLREYLASRRLSMGTQPEATLEYEKAWRLGLDIVTSRIHKMLMLASLPDMDETMLENLTPEERDFYAQLFRIVQQWRENVTAFLEGKI